MNDEVLSLRNDLSDKSISNFCVPKNKQVYFRSKHSFMGLVYADIELINGDDLALARRNIIDVDDVKKMHVNTLVDTGALMLCINENIQEQLQFAVVEKRKAQMANGSIVECDVVAPVELRDLKTDRLLAAQWYCQAIQRYC